MAARQVLNKGWRYHAHSGNFKTALRLEEFPIPFASSNNNVLVRMQAAPVSQLDLDQIRGVGKLNKPLPAVAGITGAGVVAEVGKGSPFKEGDRVVLTSPIGSWSTYQSAQNSQVVKVPESVPVEYASLFSVGPLVAYNILKLAKLSKGESVIVNGSDSVLGLSILQIAKQFGINAVGLIQSSADSDIKIEKLKQLGLDVRADPLLDVKSLGEAPRLGINLVGGFSAAHLARLVRAEGTILTIGSSSNEPHLFHNSDLVDKELTVRGGPIFSWLPSSNEIEKSVTEVSSLIKENKLKLFVLRHELKNVQDAIDDAENLRKVILMHEGNEKTWSNIPRDEYMKLDEKVQNIWKAASAQQEPYLSSGKEQPWTTAKGHEPAQPSSKTAQKLEKISSVEELEKELSSLTPEQKEELGIPNVGSVTLTPEQLKLLVEKAKNKK